MTTSPCGLATGTVRIAGTIDAGGKRGCGIGNDSGGGGAGGTVLIVGDLVEVRDSAVVSAAGGLGGDTRAAASGQPNYTDCPAGAQSSGTCDDCGGGGGGGIISVLSINSDLASAATFNVSGALGGTCTVCKGEAGGGAGELQLDGAYVGEYCDGYDNDFDGDVDEDLGTQVCGLGSCAETIDACNVPQGQPLSCEPETDTDASCKSPADGARPRIAVILDTSASMLLSLNGYPTFGDGSQEHPGIDVDGDGLANDSRLLLAREALAQVISAYPEIDFSLSRYHQDQGEDRSCQRATWFECQGLVGTYDDPRDTTGASACFVTIGPDPVGPALAPKIQVFRDPLPDPLNPLNRKECINYAGSCGPPRRGADVLTGFGMPTRDIVRWLDGRETGFDPSEAPGNPRNHVQPRGLAPQRARAMSFAARVSRQAAHTPRAFEWGVRHLCAMKRRHWIIAGLLLLVLYLAVWPVPIDPVAWQAPPTPPVTDAFAPNERLGPLTDLPLLGEIGPEHVAVDAQGRLYTGTRGGKILRFAPDGSGAHVFAGTGGRPLGMELAADGTLYVADSVRGLLAVSADAKVRVLATEAGGVPIGFADDVDIGPDGTVYFSDASTKFRPQDHGGEMAASMLELIEHRGNGRLLAHDPRTGKTRVLLSGLVFANGVVLAHDGRSVLVNETGSYRTLRYWLAGEKAGRAEPFLENLPGFPDNIGRGLEGRYWVALIAPRSKELDALASWPAIRAMVMRIPGALQPRPVPRANVFAVDDTGKIVASLQSTRAPLGYTGVTETAEHLFLGSIDATALQRLPRPSF